MIMTACICALQERDNLVKECAAGKDGLAQAVVDHEIQVNQVSQSTEAFLEKTQEEAQAKIEQGFEPIALRLP